MSILDDIEGRLKQIESDVQRSVETAILTGQAKFILSRLATLDPSHADKYTAMVAQL